MKKSLLALSAILAFATTNAQANNAQKIAVVKQAYDNVRKVQDWLATLRRYGTANLNYNLGLDETDPDFDIVPCYFYWGSGGDPFYGSSDPDFTAKVSVGMNSRGWVVASVYSSRYRTSHSVAYVVKLENGKYKIDDIILYGRSFNAYAKKYCS
ncbi:hypothetical protein [Moraxella cuniculi]|uniref:DUF3828 domain-containing protein n=1 Tax=Moraxella cuniculi TaxID=34061 RepID=A0A448GV06_9GAMM|nr:hypothetical protein [Moraxella cuniculi]VEG12654.1 Uncharacterised protein [Moraxella cuniculi]